MRKLNEEEAQAAVDGLEFALTAPGLWSDKRHLIDVALAALRRDAPPEIGHEERRARQVKDEDELQKLIVDAAAASRAGNRLGIDVEQMLFYKVQRFMASQEEEHRRTRDGLCVARIHHGPGHQSSTFCELTGNHKIHHATFGEFDSYQEWEGYEAFSD